MSEPRFYLNNIDSEDVADVVVKIERSFHIRFSKEDLAGVRTFGDLCEVVQKKIDVKNVDSCTTQQAFYKLKNAIKPLVVVDRFSIKPQTKLAEILPKEKRLILVNQIEEEIGFKLELLKPKDGVILAFLITLVTSIVMLFFYPRPAIVGLGTVIIGIAAAKRFGKELNVVTLGDLAHKISREHYALCRRNPSTVNQQEIIEKIRELFSAELYLDPSVLTKESNF